MENIGFTPIILTQAQSNLTFPAGGYKLKVKGEVLKIEVPAFKGMSGGPVFMINQGTNTIHVLGVILKGTMNIQYAAIFE